jgi:hypothetical protein
MGYKQRPYLLGDVRVMTTDLLDTIPRKQIRYQRRQVEIKVEVEPHKSSRLRFLNSQSAIRQKNLTT